MLFFRASIVKKILVVLALVCFAPAAHCAAPDWVKRHYGSLDGLPVDSVSSAAIDADGFLWLATHDGLARFDGEHFAVYDSMRYPAMSGNRVLSLHKDADDRLFALTEHGDWLRVQSQAIAQVDMGDASSAARRARFVDTRSLCVTATAAFYCPDGSGAYQRLARFPDGVDAMLALRGVDDTVWLVSPARDIWLYRHGKWQAMWRAGAQQDRSIPTYAAVDSDGALWTEILGRTLRVTLTGEQTYLAADNDPQSIVQIRLGVDDKIWIGAANGVFVVRNGKSARVFVDATVDGSAAYLSWRALDGALWVANGPLLWRLPTEESTQATPVLNGNGDIRNLLFGPGNLIWVMTLRDGMYRLNQPRVDVLTTEDGLAGGNVYSVSRDDHGRMWLGTLGSGLISVAADGQVQSDGNENGLPGPNPWLVASAPDGSLYVATYAPGLWRRAPGATRFDPVPLPAELSRELIRAVTFDASGQPWIGTTAGAWRDEHGTWRRVWPTTARRVRVDSIAIQAQGVWFGTDAGVWFQQGDHEHAVAAKLLAHTTVRDVQFTRDGALWIATVGRGLVRVVADDPLGLHPLQLGRAQGLPSNSPHTLREDANGNFWVNSNQGIFRIAPSGLKALLAGTESTLSPLVLGLSDGLTELEGNGGVQPAAAWDARGRLWFPSQAGVVRFDPLAIHPRGKVPQPVITTVASEGHDVMLDAKGRLPVGVRNVRILYGAANLFGNGKSRFRYRLLPQSHDWTETTADASAVFTALPPGQYRFELLAGNSDGVWTSKPTVLTFDVPPRWYERSAIQLTGLLALIVALLWLMRWRLRRLHRRASRLNRQVHERTGELREEKDRAERTLAALAEAHGALESSNLQLASQAQKLEESDRFRSRLLADVSHELRTPVMLVDLPLKELSEHPTGMTARGRERLAMATRQLGRLRDLVEQLVGLVQAEARQTTLRLRRLDLIGHLRAIVHDYQLKAEHVGVTLVLDTEIDALIVFADGAHLATVFGNLIDNATKHAPPGSVISVRVMRDDESAVIEVRDSGPGFDPAIAARLFERFYRGEGPPRQGREGLGIGLSLARELVELHAGRIAALALPGAGATFRIELPLGSTHVALDELALDAATLPLPTTPAMHADDGDGCILLVEDHPDLAAYLTEGLSERVRTVCAGSVEEARKLLADEPRIRLVVSDVALPGASGVTLCQELQAGAPEQRKPVILISAKAADRDRAAGLAAGAFVYLVKPFAFDDLLQAVASAWPALAPRLLPSPAHADQLDPLLRLALANIGNVDFQIVGWADLAHLSERQLRRRVKELTGLSPQAWLREQRLLRVRHLLRSGQCKILAEAGTRCGLDNPAYLYRSYRARFGDD